MPGINTNSNVTLMLGYHDSERFGDYVSAKKAEVSVKRSEVALNALKSLCEVGAITPEHYRLKAKEVLEVYLDITNVI